MNVLEIPFNKFLGIQRAESKTEFIFKLDSKKEYLNHLGTIHASVLFSLAEASSGEYLLNQFKDYNLDIIPVIRKVETKYSLPGKGSAYSKATFVNNNVENFIKELNSKNRAIIKVKVDIFNEEEKKLMTSVFDWFISKK